MIDSLLKSGPVRRARNVFPIFGGVLVLAGLGQAFTGTPSGLVTALIGAGLVYVYFRIPTAEAVAARGGQKAQAKLAEQARLAGEERATARARFEEETKAEQQRLRRDPNRLARAHDDVIAATGGLVFLGEFVHGDGSGSTSVHVPANQHVLALGPPRSGKTSTVVVPSILGTDRPLVSTSTKDDVLSITAGARGRLGNLWLFDPGGSVPDREGITRIRWSPTQVAGSWDEAQPAGHLLVEASASSSGGAQNEGYWRERAGSLLGPLLLAANSSGGSMREVLSWVNQRTLDEPLDLLHKAEARTASDILTGIERTDQRELSGIWSTLASALSAYSRDTVIRSTEQPNFDPNGFPLSRDTIYVCSPTDDQRSFAPIMVLFLDGLRRAVYQAHRTGQMQRGAIFMLDELANIAPIPNLPGMLSEAASQGLQIVACLQDLSQARQIWHEAGDGLLTMFGSKLVFGGINDRQTLELLSKVAGEFDEHVMTVGSSQSETAGGGYGGPSHTTSTSLSAQVMRRERLPVSEIVHQTPGTVLWFALNGVVPIAQRPWYGDPLWPVLVEQTAVAQAGGEAKTPRQELPA